jgi:hypothetical protein
VEGLKEKGVNNKCPRCRGELTDVQALFDESVMLLV